MEVRRKSKLLDQAKKFVVKGEDELDLLEADPEKENYINNYRKYLINFAACGRKKVNNYVQGLAEAYTISQIEPIEELLEEH